MQLITNFWNAILNTLNWTWASITLQLPWYQNYFYGLILISLVVWGLEILFPWRKNQSIFRRDFFLDAFYMFFNFFLFAIGISGFYAIFETLFSKIGVNLDAFAIIPLDELPLLLALLLFFILNDFVQWLTHIALHRFPVLWEYHKVHHSVKEMGFAAHLRYHWMENILYKPLKVLVVMLIGGFEPESAFIVHFIAISIGHLNHANIKITYGPFKYLFNNPVMHLYHHAYELPKDRPYGMNYGISLSIWDYLFGTSYMPDQNGNIKLGFPGDEQFPSDFIGQSKHGFQQKKER